MCWRLLSGFRVPTCPWLGLWVIVLSCSVTPLSSFLLWTCITWEVWKFSSTRRLGSCLAIISLEYFLWPAVFIVQVFSFFFCTFLISILFWEYNFFNSVCYIEKYSQCEWKEAASQMLHLK